MKNIQLDSSQSNSKRDKETVKMGLEFELTCSGLSHLLWGISEFKDLIRLIQINTNYQQTSFQRTFGLL